MCIRDRQYVYTLRRMLAPIKEHVDNNFNPLPKAYETEYEPIRRRVCLLYTSGKCVNKIPHFGKKPTDFLAKTRDLRLYSNGAPSPVGLYGSTT